MKGFRYGAVIKVQREHTLEKIYSMLDKMKAIGMNTVVVWPAVYWWEDKTSPNYPYQTGHDILKYAEKIDMQVVMELAGQNPALEYVPDFAMKDDYFALDEDGKRNYLNNAYGYYNFNHPGVRHLIEKNYTDAARHYKGYSSLFGYDIWNETMFTSYDHYTLELFRDWLKSKYGTIEKLNDSWDRTFYDWSQIEFCRWLWASIMAKVDYEEFHKDNIGIILDFMKQCIRSVDDVHPVIADNVFSEVMLGAGYNRPQDDWNVAAHVEIFGMDIYPKFFAQMVLPDFSRWQAFTGSHSATKTGKFWVSELQTHHTYMFDPATHVYPHEIRKWCWEAISHGAKGVVFWKWNPFNKGTQTFGRGLVNFKGEYTPRAEEAGKVATILAENEKAFLEYMPPKPKVAILFDRLSYDFIATLSLGLMAASGGENNLYMHSMAGLYKCLWEHNIAAKYIADRDILENNLDGYKVIFISNHVNISPELAQGLKRFVEQGGTIIADGRFAEINNTGLLYEQMPGAGFCDTAGFEILDMRADGLGMAMDEKVCGKPFEMDGFFERREMVLQGDGLNVWARYGDGSPAIVQGGTGKGEIVYISSQLWCGYLKTEQAAIGEFMSFLDKRYALRTFGISDDTLKVCMLDGEDGALVFVFNYTGADATAQLQVNLGHDGEYNVTELYSKNSITASAAGGRLSITAGASAGDVSIYKITKA